jgi:hypothetical protein
MGNPANAAESIAQPEASGGAQDGTYFGGRET